MVENTQHSEGQQFLSTTTLTCFCLLSLWLDTKLANRQQLKLVFYYSDETKNKRMSGH